MKCFLSAVDNTFALAVPKEDGTYGHVFNWPTRQQAEAHLKEQLKIAPKLHKLGPFEIEQWIVEEHQEPTQQ